MPLSHSQRSTVNGQRSTLNGQRSTLGGQRSTARSARPLLPRTVMILSSRSSMESSSQTQAEFDLLETVLFGEDVTYPWNPGECEDLDETPAFRDPLKVDDLNLGDRSPVFFAQLDSCMIYAQLCERFGTQVPAPLLKRICGLAKQISSRDLSRLDQLIACVQPLLPHSTMEELQGLAGPFATGIDGETPDYSVGHPWEQLSSFEQARLSLAIAHFTLQQLIVKI